MPQAQQVARHEERVQQFLEQHPSKALTLQEIARGTQTSQDQLKGTLGSMTGNGGQVTKLGQQTYMYTKAPLPKKGTNFSGEVVGVSFSGAAIVRDNSGASWKIEPIV